MIHLKNYTAVSEVLAFAETHLMEELSRLCSIVLARKPNIDKKCNWVRWKKGDSLPAGAFFDGYDKDGWPIGIARVNKSVSALDIRTMTVRK